MDTFCANTTNERLFVPSAMAAASVNTEFKGIGAPIVEAPQDALTGNKKVVARHAEVQVYVFITNTGTGAQYASRVDEPHSTKCFWMRHELRVSVHNTNLSQDGFRPVNL